MKGTNHFERFEIPSENKSLPGYYVPGDLNKNGDTLIIVVNGYDSIKEEEWFVIGKAAHDRGFSFMSYDGPGQGGAIRENKSHDPRSKAFQYKPNALRADSEANWELTHGAWIMNLGNDWVEVMFQLDVMGYPTIKDDFELRKLWCQRVIDRINENNQLSEP